MKIPLSWLKDFIDLDGLSIEDIARKLTLAGLEVDEIVYVGLAMPVNNEDERHEFKTSGIAWDKEKIVVAEIREVMPHPNADRLTLCDLFDGRETTYRPHRRAQYLSPERPGQTAQADQGRLCQGKRNLVRRSCRRAAVDDAQAHKDPRC